MPPFPENAQNVGPACHQILLGRPCQATHDMSSARCQPTCPNFLLDMMGKQPSIEENHAVMAKFGWREL